MSPIPAFRHRNLLCIESTEEPGVFLYLPEEPGPERGANGRPTLTLMASDQGGIVQLGARWAADPEELESLRSELALRLPETGCEPPELRPAPAYVDEVVLSIARVENELEPAASSTSSGISPFTALLRAQLDAEQKTAVVSCLHGRTGFLTVAYAVRSPDLVEVEATIAGDPSRTLRELAPGADRAALRLALERALEAGELMLELTSPPEAPDELRSAVSAMVLDAALEWLERKIEAATEGGSWHLEVRASRAEIVWTSRTRTADLSTWFPDGTGTDHIIVLPATLDGSKKASKR